MKSWSTSQSTISLSSGESELYALTKSAIRISGMISLADDFGIKLKGVVKSDSNAAIGIVHRDGLGGRSRHIRVQYLWIQEKVRSKELDIRKVLGTENLADLMTKPLGSEPLRKFLSMLGYLSERGRAVKSSRLVHSLTPSPCRTSSVGGCENASYHRGGHCCKHSL